MSALVIVPYFDRPISDLKEKLLFYTSLRVVSGVQVIEFDAGRSAADVLSMSPKIRVVHRPNDLRYRFISEHPCDAEYTIICDDDICPKADLLSSMMQRIENHPTELVGVFGRQVCRRTISYLSRQQNNNVDMVLTKLMIGRRDLVDRLGAVVRSHGALLGAMPLNAEDIVFSMLWSYYIGRNTCLPASFTALVRDDISKLGGLCLKKNHVQQRTDALRKCVAQCTSEQIRQIMKLAGFQVVCEDPLRLSHIQTKQHEITQKVEQTQVPSRRDVLRRNRLQRRRASNVAWCEAYWCKRYDEGGCSGSKSYGDSSICRGRVISNIISSIGASSVLDVGCGDVCQVSQIKVAKYVGIDVSSKIISKNVQHANTYNTGKQFIVANAVPHHVSSEVILLMDVLHCVIDDGVYDRLLQSVFSHPSAVCVLIVSNSKDHAPAQHMKFRNFLPCISETYTTWNLVDVGRETKFMANIYKFVRSQDTAKIVSMTTDWFNKHAKCIQNAWLQRNHKHVCKIQASWRGASVRKLIKSVNYTKAMTDSSKITEFWPAVASNNFKDRKNRTEGLIANLLNRVENPRILDIGGVDFQNMAELRGWEYVTIDLENAQTVGTGGYQSSSAMKYDGKVLPFESNTFDLINVGFVLHHASENTLGLLKQIKAISRKYVIIGEDVAAQDYPMSWHERNWIHHPGGLFRSDVEWRQLFEIFNLKLLETYGVRRLDDPDDRLYRAIYILDAS